jgi:hypothetical protein
MNAFPPVGDEPFKLWQSQSRFLDQLQIVFIVGPPKCGTTWVMEALNGHPNAIARGESAVGRALIPNLLAAFQNYNAHQTKFGDHRHTFFGDADFMFFLRQVVDRQFIQYIATARQKTSERILAVMDKTPAHSQHIDLLAAVYPRSKFICCTRDVRDGAVSGWFHFAPQGWLKQKTLEEYARVYASQSWGPMMRDARASAGRVGAARYLEIDYAAHKSDPESKIHKLLQFIGLPDSERHISACIESGDFRKASGGRSPGTEDRGSFFRKGVVGDWANHMSPEVGDELLALAQAVVERPKPVAAT